MFTLSDDKSAYTTLQGLVAALQRDVEEAKYRRAKHTARSQEHARLTGAIGALNSTIALIYSTDVWQAGIREEQSQSHFHTYDIVNYAKHVHMTDLDLNAYLQAEG